MRARDFFFEKRYDRPFIQLRRRCRHRKSRFRLRQPSPAMRFSRTVRHAENDFGSKFLDAKEFAPARRARPPIRDYFVRSARAMTLHDLTITFGDSCMSATTAAGSVVSHGRERRAGRRADVDYIPSWGHISSSSTRWMASRSVLVWASFANDSRPCPAMLWSRQKLARSAALQRRQRGYFAHLHFESPRPTRPRPLDRGTSAAGLRQRALTPGLIRKVSEPKIVLRFQIACHCRPKIVMPDAPLIADAAGILFSI